MDRRSVLSLLERRPSPCSAGAVPEANAQQPKKGGTAQLCDQRRDAALRSARSDTFATLHFSRVLFDAADLQSRPNTRK